MSYKDQLSALSQRLAGLFPAATDVHEKVQEELRTKIEHTLKKGFSELDLMTREEFETQARALERALEHVAELEVQVKAMEQKLDAISASRQ